MGSLTLYDSQDTILLTCASFQIEQGNSFSFSFSLSLYLAVTARLLISRVQARYGGEERSGRGKSRPVAVTRSRKKRGDSGRASDRASDRASERERKKQSERKKGRKGEEEKKGSGATSPVLVRRSSVRFLASKR